MQTHSQPLDQVHAQPLNQPHVEHQSRNVKLNTQRRQSRPQGQAQQLHHVTRQSEVAGGGGFGGELESASSGSGSGSDVRSLATNMNTNTPPPTSTSTPLLPSTAAASSVSMSGAELMAQAAEEAAKEMGIEYRSMTTTMKQQKAATASSSSSSSSHHSTHPTSKPTDPIISPFFTFSTAPYSGFHASNESHSSASTAAPNSATTASSASSSFATEPASAPLFPTRFSALRYLLRCAQAKTAKQRIAKAAHLLMLGDFAASRGIFIQLRNWVDEAINILTNGSPDQQRITVDESGNDATGNKGVGEERKNPAERPSSPIPTLHILHPLTSSTPPTVHPFLSDLSLDDLYRARRLLQSNLSLVAEREVKASDPRGIGAAAGMSTAEGSGSGSPSSSISTLIPTSASASVSAVGPFRIPIGFRQKDGKCRYFRNDAERKEYEKWREEKEKQKRMIKSTQEQQQHTTQQLAEAQRNNEVGPSSAALPPPSTHAASRSASTSFVSSVSHHAASTSTSSHRHAAPLIIARSDELSPIQQPMQTGTGVAVGVGVGAATMSTTGMNVSTKTRDDGRSRRQGTVGEDVDEAMDMGMPMRMHRNEHLVTAELDWQRQQEKNPHPQHQTHERRENVMRMDEEKEEEEKEKGDRGQEIAHHGDEKKLMPRDAALRHKQMASTLVADPVTATAASTTMASDDAIQHITTTRPPSPAPIPRHQPGVPEAAQHSQLAELPYHDSTMTIASKSQSEKSGEKDRTSTEVDVAGEMPAPASILSSRHLFIDEQGRVEDAGMSETGADLVGGVDSQLGPSPFIPLLPLPPPPSLSSSFASVRASHRGPSSSPGVTASSHDGGIGDDASTPPLQQRSRARRRRGGTKVVMEGENEDEDEAGEEGEVEKQERMDEKVVEVEMEMEMEAVSQQAGTPTVNTAAVSRSKQPRRRKQTQLQVHSQRNGRRGMTRNRKERVETGDQNDANVDDADDSKRENDSTASQTHSSSARRSKRKRSRSRFGVEEDDEEYIPSDENDIDSDGVDIPGRTQHGTRKRRKWAGKHDESQHPTLSIPFTSPSPVSVTPMLMAWSPSSVITHPRHVGGRVGESSSLSLSSSSPSSSSCSLATPQLAAHSAYSADMHRYDIRYEYEYVQRQWQRLDRRLQSRDRIVEEEEVKRKSKKEKKTIITQPKIIQQKGKGGSDDHGRSKGMEMAQVQGEKQRENEA